MKKIELSNGIEIPSIGFGTYKIQEENIFSDAIEVGYRYFDSASFYQNEEVLGLAIRNSKVPREDFFLSSKCWRSEMGYENAIMAFEQSCKRLQVDYLDKYMIHWPRPNLVDPNWREVSCQTWKALEDLYKAQKVRVIGISNFLPHHLDNLLSKAEIIPMVNQLELHPGFLQEEAVNYSRMNGMVIEAWSPLGCSRLFNNEVLKQIAEKHNCSVAEVCIAFEVSMKVIPLPKASVRERMFANLCACNLQLDEEDIDKIVCMEMAGWSGEHPDRERVKNLYV